MSTKPNVPPAARDPSAIVAYDHVGIRVSNREESLAFYQALGFGDVQSIGGDYAAELSTPAGVRINLIFNGTRLPERHNVLLDEPVRAPGVTHPAFVVDDLNNLIAWLAENGIRITEGPHPIGPRRVALFIRDPDGNVLEFNQIVPFPNHSHQGDTA